MNEKEARLTAEELRRKFILNFMKGILHLTETGPAEYEPSYIFTEVKKDIHPLTGKACYAATTTSIVYTTVDRMDIPLKVFENNG